MAFRGFDTAYYPGLEVMTAFKAEFDFVGFYLHAPSHPERSWSGKRDELVDLGFGLLPIFVGQQIVGPGQHVVTPEQGEIDGAEAAEEMKAEGFPPGSRVFVDLENGPPFGKLQSAYVFGVLQAIEAGGYRGGLYCSHAMAAACAAAFPDAPIWTVRVPTVAKTAAAPPFTAPNPTLGGWSDAVAWQYRQNVETAIDGHRLLIDLDTAAMADPSAPG